MHANQASIYPFAYKRAVFNDLSDWLSTDLTGNTDENI